MAEENCYSKYSENKWELQEEVYPKTFRRTPFVKTFNCLAEARKALIYYIKNPDFTNIHFRLRKNQAGKP